MDEHEKMNTSNKTGWVFGLFVAGKTPKADHTVAILEQICETYLEGTCDINVIDVIQDPFTSMEENIIATPTLIKQHPKPSRRIIGDLSNQEQLLLGLEIL